MPIPWATSGLDLHVELAGRRSRRALEEGLREAITSGRLAAGAPVPSSRSLARDLGLARNTVAEAYGQLGAEGWLEARQGSGTRVAPTPQSVPSGTSPARSRRLPYDLRPGSPDVASFPRREWLAASRRAWLEAPDPDFGYGDPAGLLPLRQQLASYLSRARGLRAEPGHIVICSGFTQALGLVCAALGPHRIALESHGLPVVRAILADAGWAIETVPVDEHGAAVGSVGDATVMLLTPAHQFPLGAVLGARRRRAALEWARGTAGFVIEDDYDGEFRYDREPLGAMQGMDPEVVIYVGTASKTLAPALRLAWLVVPAALAPPIAQAKRRADTQSGVLEQLTLAEYLRTNGYDRHVRRRRTAYRRRRDALVQLVTETAPKCRIEGISAGLHALITLPSGATEEQALALAVRRDLALQGLATFSAEGQEAAPGLVVGYASPAEHAFVGALDRLGEVLRELST
jgi:GntR family transcriptional regulator/MocR family aminotransferase